MKPLHWIALALVIVGAVNWGLVGLLQFDLVAAVFGGQSEILSRIVYSLVGASGIVVALTSLASGPYSRTSGHHHATMAAPVR